MPDDGFARPLRGETLHPPGADLAIAEWESPPGETLWIAPLHIHHDADEIWYVLEGELILHLDGEEVRLGPGDCGTAVRGVSHAYRNAGPGPLRYLLVMTRQVADLIAALHTGPRDREALEMLFREYGSTYLGWLPAPEG
ncbi:MAG: cupin domain-containing protein [Thermomicrobiales bacterium]